MLTLLPTIAYFAHYGCRLLDSWSRSRTLPLHPYPYPYPTPTPDAGHRADGEGAWCEGHRNATRGGNEALGAFRVRVD